VKLPERRRKLERACAYFVDRVTARAICPRQGQSPLLPRVHLRIGTYDKNQIANRERDKIAADMNFNNSLEKLGAHGFVQ